MLKSLLVLSLLAISPAFALAQAKELGEGKISFTTSQAPWTLVLSLKGFTLGQQQVKPDGSSAYFMMSNEGTYLNASLWIEPVDKCKTSKECRDMVWKAGNPGWGEFKNPLLSEIGDVSFFEFYRPTVQGQPVKMLDMYAEFVKDGYWIDLHISKVLYKKEDHVLFENLVKSAQFVPKK